MLVKIKTKKLGYLAIGLLISSLFIYFTTTNTKAEEYIFKGNLDAANQELWQLNQDINNKRSEIQELEKQISVYKKNISAKQKTLSTLANQMVLIDDNIAKINLEVKSVELEVEETNLKIANAELQIKAKEQEISDKKEVIGQLIRNVHRDQQKTNLLEVLLSNENFSDFMAEVDRLETMQKNLVAGVKELENDKAEVEKTKLELENNQVELTLLQDRLTVKEEELTGQKTIKIALLNETQGQEAKFQELLEQAKKEQEQINADIVYLEQVARERLNRQLETQELSSDGFMWPVSSRTVTAYFHDPDYPYRNIFEHPAVDIATPQGTAIKAVDSGYVAKTKDGGKGYSYIMLVHADGISTVYGHVNVISVSEDQFISKGQIIGYSGGMPGTAGAGSLTTGPHLHLEFRLNGIPVNPLNYLP